jgi:hemoglobin
MLFSRPLRGAIAIALCVGGVGGAGCGGSQERAAIAEPVAHSRTTDAGVAVPIDAAAPSSTQTAPLWQRLGGKDRVVSIIDELLVIVLADNRINAFFEPLKKDASRRNQLRDLLVAFVCAKTGGAECGYAASRSLKDAHKDMKLSDAHFDAFVEDATIALASKRVPEEVAEDLLAELGKYRGDVVTPKK